MVYSIQHIRAFAAILVVMSHVDGELQPLENPFFLPNFQEVNIAFTFAAGFLFQHLSIKESYQSFLMRRMRNVLIPYVLISLPAVLIYAVGAKTHPHIDLGVFPEWLLPLYLLLTGLHLGPLWFIPMIFLIYLCTPLIKPIDRYGWAYGIAIPLTLVLAMTAFPRPEFNHLPPQAAAHYLPVFLIGMACGRYNPTLADWSQKPVIWGAALVGLVGLFWASADWSPEAQFPAKIALLLCVFVLASRAEHIRSGVIDSLAAFSFGIFFLHGYLVAVLRALEGRGLFALDYTAFNLVMMTVLVCFGCVAIIQVAKGLFGARSRYMVGA